MPVRAARAVAATACLPVGLSTPGRLGLSCARPLHLLLTAGAAALTLRTRRALRCRVAVRAVAVTAHSLRRWPARVALFALSRRIHLADFELALFHHRVALPIFEMITTGN